MDPFEVMQRRGHLFTEDPGFSKTLTHSGSHDDYDQARGPARSLTARSDKMLTRRDMRMPVDLTRSRKVGLSRTRCYDCQAVKDQGVCRHTKSCSVRIYGNQMPVSGFVRETTGPMASNETSAEVGWR